MCVGRGAGCVCGCVMQVRYEGVEVEVGGAEGGWCGYDCGCVCGCSLCSWRSPRGRSRCFTTISQDSREDEAYSLNI